MDAHLNYSTCAGCRTRFHQWEVDSWRFPQCPECGGVVFVADPKRLALGAILTLLFLTLSLLLPSSTWAAVYHWTDGWKGATYTTATNDASTVCAAAADAIELILVGGEAGASLTVTGCSGSASEVGQSITLALHGAGCGFCEFNISGQTQTLSSIEEDEEEEEEPGSSMKPLHQLIFIVGCCVMFGIGFIGGVRT